MTKPDIHPEHVSPDYLEIEARLEELGITKLSDDIGVSFDAETENVTLHDNLHAYTPRNVHTLTDFEMWALINYWIDGHCLCGSEIPQAHYLCRNCLDEAIHNHGLRLEGRC